MWFLLFVRLWCSTTSYKNNSYLVQNRTEKNILRKTSSHVFSPAQKFDIRNLFGCLLPRVGLWEMIFVTSLISESLGSCVSSFISWNMSSELTVLSDSEFALSILTSYSPTESKLWDGTSIWHSDFDSCSTITISLVFNIVFISRLYSLYSSVFTRYPMRIHF